MDNIYIPYGTSYDVDAPVSENGELINGKYFNQCYVSGCAQLLCTDSGIIAGAAAAKAAK